MSLWTQLVCESAYVANPASLGAACGAGNDLGALTEQPRPRRSDAVSARIVRPPNGSRLSCGRSARRRGNAILPTRAPGSFKRMLGGTFIHDCSLAVDEMSAWAKHGLPMSGATM